MILYDIMNITTVMKELSSMNTVTTFQMKLPEELNRKIKADAAASGKTKHEWIMNAIVKQLADNNKAV